jgi:hypothetical protein
MEKFMGAVNDAVKKLEEQQDATAQELKSSLQMLSTLAEAKKKELMAEVDSRMSLARQDALHSNNQVPPGLMLYEYGETRVSTAQGPSAGITSAIKGLLQNPADNWRDAVAGLATVALNTLLGAGGGASSNTSLYMIAMDGRPASGSEEDSQVVVRIDYCLWTYNFTSNGVKDVAQSAVAYFARKSLIDYQHIASDVAVEQLLTLTGLKKELRDELLAKIAKEKAANGKTPALRAYAGMLPGALNTAITRHYAL